MFLRYFTEKLTKRFLRSDAAKTKKVLNYLKRKEPDLSRSAILSSRIDPVNQSPPLEGSKQAIYYDSLPSVVQAHRLEQGRLYHSGRPKADLKSSQGPTTSKQSPVRSPIAIKSKTVLPYRTKFNVNELASFQAGQRSTEIPLPSSESFSRPPQKARRIQLTEDYLKPELYYIKRKRTRETSRVVPTTSEIDSERDKYALDLAASTTVFGKNNPSEKPMGEVGTRKLSYSGNVPRETCACRVRNNPKKICKMQKDGCLRCKIAPNVRPSKNRAKSDEDAETLNSKTFEDLTNEDTLNKARMSRKNLNKAKINCVPKSESKIGPISERAVRETFSPKNRERSLQKSGRNSRRHPDSSVDFCNYCKRSSTNQCNVQENSSYHKDSSSRVSSCNSKSSSEKYPDCKKSSDYLDIGGPITKLLIRDIFTSKYREDTESLESHVRDDFNLPASLEKKSSKNSIDVDGDPRKVKLSVEESFSKHLINDLTSADSKFRKWKKLASSEESSKNVLKYSDKGPESEIVHSNTVSAEFVVPSSRTPLEKFCNRDSVKSATYESLPEIAETAEINLSAQLPPSISTEPELPMAYKAQQVRLSPAKNRLISSKTAEVDISAQQPPAISIEPELPMAYKSQQVRLSPTKNRLISSKTAEVDLSAQQPPAISIEPELPKAYKSQQVRLSPTKNRLISSKTAEGDLSAQQPPAISIEPELPMAYKSRQVRLSPTKNRLISSKTVEGDLSAQQPPAISIEPELPMAYKSQQVRLSPTKNRLISSKTAEGDLSAQQPPAISIEPELPKAYKSQQVHMSPCSSTTKHKNDASAEEYIAHFPVNEVILPDNPPTAQADNYEWQNESVPYQRFDGEKRLKYPKSRHLKTDNKNLEYFGPHSKTNSENVENLSIKTSAKMVAAALLNEHAIQMNESANDSLNDDESLTESRNPKWRPVPYFTIKNGSDLRKDMDLMSKIHFTGAMYLNSKQSTKDEPNDSCDEHYELYATDEDQYSHKTATGEWDNSLVTNDDNGPENECSHKMISGERSNSHSVERTDGGDGFCTPPDCVNDELFLEARDCSKVKEYDRCKLIGVYSSVNCVTDEFLTGYDRSTGKTEEADSFLYDTENSNESRCFSTMEPPSPVPWIPSTIKRSHPPYESLQVTRMPENDLISYHSADFHQGNEHDEVGSNASQIWYQDDSLSNSFSDCQKKNSVKTWVYPKLISDLAKFE